MHWKQIVVMYLTKFLCLLFVIFVEFDRASAIKCHFHNETCGAAGTCDIIDCGQDSCYSLWQNSTNSTHENTFTKLKGCFRLGSEGECADKKLCIASSRSKETLFFCCCGEDLCNEKYNWAPTPAKLPIIPRIIDEDQSEKTDYTILIAMCFVLPLSVLVFCFIYSLTKKEKISYIKKRFKLVPLLDRHRTASSVQTPRRIELLEVLATRKFGSVRKAIDLEKMQKVAVKIMSLQEEQSWLTEREIYQLPKMDLHENILQFIAAEKRINNSFTELWLITAYHEKGSLQDYLKTNTITWDQLCKIAYSMANGLAHLHEEIPSETPNQYKLSVAHRDFKSSNVILKNDFTACIGDFGLALIFRPSTSCGDTHGQVGTRRYMAPEVLEGAINFSRDGFLRIDMYAFGLVLWELASRCSSVPGNNYEYMLPFEAEVGCLPSLESIQDVVVHKKIRPMIKASWRKIPAFQVLCDTIEECWDHDAEARLSASCVLERITKAQQIGIPS